MKKDGIKYIFALGALLLAVSLACGTISTPAASSSSPQVIVVTATPESATAAGAATSEPAAAADSGGMTTFTDRNKYFAIDLPADWAHTTSEDTNIYTDTFKSPDKHGFIESVVYDDGTPWTGSQNGKGALYLLNTYYSSTGKEGDIRISDDSIQKDGSERLTWTSKGGGYSGVSFFEIRKPTAFLMFTIWWDNTYSDKYEQLLDDVVGTYRIP